MNFNVSNNNFGYLNSFFGGTSGTSGSFGSAGLLGDYFSIKNGTYYKVAKKYYASETKTGDGKSKTSGTDEKQTKLTQDAAEKAVGSLSKLMDKNLFAKVETTDADGNKVKDYDRKSILDKLKTFVDDYNSVVKDAGEMEDSSVLKSALRMIKETGVYAKSLGKLGISIGKDNTLSIDEEKFNEADMLEAKNLFTGGVSFGSNMQAKLLQVYNTSVSALNSSGGIYSAQAKTGLSIGSMFDSLL